LPLLLVVEEVEDRRLPRDDVRPLAPEARTVEGRSAFGIFNARFA
jgi:hypothetical protein